MTIKAKIIKQSRNHSNQVMTTMEIEYPRFILAELNTHRMLSKNSASSRAIPTKLMREQILNDPALPCYWGSNQPGMQAGKEVSDPKQAKLAWLLAMHRALESNQELEALDLHKQITNRVTEPWMTMKTVISGTEWSNFFYLRAHPAAQPELQQLARLMLEAYEAQEPELLYPGEWHLPYITTKRNNNQLEYWSGDQMLTLEQAKKVSASCCAQVSYRKSDTGLEKAEKIFDQLINSKPCHASPVEHQATPMPDRFQQLEYTKPELWPQGISHQDRESYYWSGNLKGWIQHRKLIPGESA